MGTLTDNLTKLIHKLPDDKVTLVVVSKTHPVEKIMELYEAGHRDFGENRVQELLDKKDKLPSDIRWHLIGHLQRNKVKYIVPFIHLIHSVDSLRLLEEINKETEKNGLTVNCLLQVFIASEETKFGLSEQELEELLQSEELNFFHNIKICGLMGMASNTPKEDTVRDEFAGLKTLYEKIKAKYYADSGDFKILSMGMSGDYMLAIEEGSTMVRLGSAVFGERL